MSYVVHEISFPVEAKLVIRYVKLLFIHLLKDTENKLMSKIGVCHSAQIFTPGVGHESLTFPFREILCVCVCVLFIVCVILLRYVTVCAIQVCQFHPDRLRCFYYTKHLWLQSLCLCKVRTSSHLWCILSPVDDLQFTSCS